MHLWHVWMELLSLPLQAERPSLLLTWLQSDPKAGLPFSTSLVPSSPGA